MSGEERAGSSVFHLRVAWSEIEELRALAREESVRRGEDITWAELTREAIRELVRRRQEAQCSR